MNHSADIHVAVGVIRRGDQVLIARRPNHVHQGGLLEFPGGKVESGETVQQALIREIREETGLAIASSELTPLIGIRHDYGDKRVFLDVWEAQSRTGDAEGKEGQSVGWRAISDLHDDDFPAANRPIIRALRLPRRYAITGDAPDLEGFMARLKRATPGQTQSLCLLRAPQLDMMSYHRLVAAVLSGSSGHERVDWMLHGDPSLIRAFPSAAGLHMPWREARLHETRPIGSGYWLAVSCHTNDEIRHAVKLDADFITLGPVKPTESHPDAPSLGLEAFRALVADSPVVVFGLGGLGLQDEWAVVSAGAQGIAGIRYWWATAKTAASDAV